MTSYIKSENHIMLVFDDGSSCTVYSTTSNYSAVCTAIKNNDWDNAKLLAQPSEVFKKTIKDITKVTISDGVVSYDGIPMHTTLTDRILDMHKHGFNIAPMALFLENIMENPSYRAVNELYNFLEISKLPITEDGYFLAYKRITGNYTDLHTGEIDNSPGKIVEMRRNGVNEDKNQTCSSGLHFCARDYLPFFGSYSTSHKIIMIKINPRDVVSIPSDYNNAKGRCCKYYVVKELAIDFDSEGNLPEENLEGAFKDSRIVVDKLMIEQLSLKEALLGEHEPTVIMTFNSPTTAMHSIGIDSSSITKVCNNTRRAAGGYAWRWAKDNPNNRLESDDDNSQE